MLHFFLCFATLFLAPLRRAMMLDAATPCRLCHYADISLYATLRHAITPRHAISYAFDTSLSCAFRCRQLVMMMAPIAMVVAMPRYCDAAVFTLMLSMPRIDAF